MAPTWASARATAAASSARGAVASTRAPRVLTPAGALRGPAANREGRHLDLVARRVDPGGDLERHAVERDGARDLVAQRVRGDELPDRREHLGLVLRERDLVVGGQAQLEDAAVRHLALGGVELGQG